MPDQISHPAGSIDLHTHSTASDGRLSPSALVDVAADCGVKLLALTDHDTLAGLDEASRQADHRGIRLVTGVEISVSWEKRTLHIVGLDVDPAHPGLGETLARIQHTREQRARDIAERLQARGLEDAGRRVAELCEGEQITRTHFARLLVDAGMSRNFQQAFKNYLAPGRPGHVAVTWARLGEAIAAIHAAGGQAVLAHPLAYRMTGAWRRRMLAAFHEAGGDALEVCCGNHDRGKTRTCARDARDYGLTGSVGSDYHGPHQHWLAPGRGLRLPPDITPVWERFTF